ncbi:DUF6888 family protein [Kovacikia minuta]
MPTTAQAITCFDICQRLTNFYLPIYLVRLDRGCSRSSSVC